MRTAIAAFTSLVAGAVVFAQGSSIARFRSSVDLVALDVCVTDREGRFLPTLEAGDFLVLEDRVPQAVSFFSAEGKVPLTAVVLIDRSSSRAGAKLESAKAAALTFLGHLGPDDAAAVIAFDRSAERITPFGSHAAAAASLVARIRAGGMTALFDAMVVGLRELQTARRAGNVPRRQALVVLSDGDDSASALAFEDVHREAQREGVLIYAVSIGSDDRRTPTFPPHEFARLANDSGGRAVHVRDLTVLNAIYADIAAELRHMYRLAYVPTAFVSDGRWRSISVRVAWRDGRARTRAGYYATRLSAPTGGGP